MFHPDLFTKRSLENQATKLKKKFFSHLDSNAMKEKYFLIPFAKKQKRSFSSVAFY